MLRLPDIRSTAVLAAVVALGATVLRPDPAAAQLSVSLDLYWEFGDGHWRPYDPGVAVDVRYRTGDRYHDRYDRRYDDRYAPRRRAAPRVPPGHRPGPGMCRLWHPGLPPGHQPPPVHCDRVWGYYGPAYVLVGPRVRPPERYYVPRSSGPSVRLRLEYRGGDRVRGSRYDRRDGPYDRYGRRDDRYESPRFKERAGPPGRAGPPPGRGRGKGKGKGKGKGPPGRGR